ncbi:hypothetical protein D3C75_238380 [compost metagenome]
MKLKYFIVVALSLLLAGCSIHIEGSNLESPPPPTMPLEIAVVGDNPFDTIRNVTFITDNLENIASAGPGAFDGLLIMHEHFEEAAGAEYKSFFKTTEYPVFFVGAENLLTAVFHDERLTLEDGAIDGFGAYVSGFVVTETKIQQWGFHIPDNATAREKNGDLITRIAKVMEDYARNKI